MVAGRRVQQQRAGKDDRDGDPDQQERIAELAQADQADAAAQDEKERGPEAQQSDAGIVMAGPVYGVEGQRRLGKLPAGQLDERFARLCGFLGQPAILQDAERGSFHVQARIQGIVAPDRQSDDRRQRQRSQRCAPAQPGCAGQRARRRPVALPAERQQVRRVYR